MVLDEVSEGRQCYILEARCSVGRDATVFAYTTRGPRRLGADAAHDERRGPGQDCGQGHHLLPRHVQSLVEEAEQLQRRVQAHGQGQRWDQLRHHARGCAYHDAHGLGPRPGSAAGTGPVSRKFTVGEIVAHDEMPSVMGRDDGHPLQSRTSSSPPSRLPTGRPIFAAWLAGHMSTMPVLMHTTPKRISR
jgi:hypothetical protein